MSMTVTRVMHSETKKFRQRNAGETEAKREMRKSIEAEQQMYLRQRHDFQYYMKQAKEKKRVARELKEAQAELKRIHKQRRDAEAVVTATEAMKTFSLDSMGGGKKNAGGKEGQKTRFEVLERVRAVAALSPEQRNDWEYFKTTWDKKMAECHGADWPKLFAEILQKVVNDLSAGDSTAFSVFMHNESQRVLADVPVLQLPGHGDGEVPALQLPGHVDGEVPALQMPGHVDGN